jgi:hypothetical protein
MKIWLVLEANNCDDDIYTSEPFYSEEAAKYRLRENYQGILNELDGNVERAERDDNSYSITCYDSDRFYGVVSSIDIKEGTP